MRNVSPSVRETMWKFRSNIVSLEFAFFVSFFFFFFFLFFFSFLHFLETGKVKTPPPPNGHARILVNAEIYGRSLMQRVVHNFQKNCKSVFPKILPGLPPPPLRTLVQKMFDVHLKVLPWTKKKNHHRDSRREERCSTYDIMLDDTRSALGKSRGQSRIGLALR